MDVLLLPLLDCVWSLRLSAAKGAEIDRRVNPDARYPAVVLLASIGDGKHQNALRLTNEVEHAFVTFGERLAKSLAA